MVTLSARTADSFDAYLEVLEKSASKAARQISNTIDLMRGGTFVSDGVDPSIVRSYFPVTVTLEVLLNHAMYRRLRDEACDLNLLRQDGCRQLQVMDIADIELVETAVRADADFLDLLMRKLSDEYSVGIPFKNYCIAQQFDWANAHNPFLTERSDEASNNMLKWLRHRRVNRSEARQAGVS